MAGDVGVNWSIAIPLVGLGITVASGIWRMSALTASFDTKIADIRTAQAERRLEVDQRHAVRRTEVDGHLARLERECVELIVQAERRYGETAAAVRQKIVDHELWTRDHLVNKEIFNSSMSSIENDFKQLNARLDLWFDRMESKIDRAVQTRE